MAVSNNFRFFVVDVDILMIPGTNHQERLFVVNFWNAPSFLFFYVFCVLHVLYVQDYEE
jgi:hypothetical protein